LATGGLAMMAKEPGYDSWLFVFNRAASPNEIDD
jgi:hypothetical protein